MSKYAITRKEEFILSEESATEQIIQFLTYYDIDINDITDEEMKKQFERALDALTNYVRRGILEVTTDADSKLNIIHLISGGGVLTCGELGARHKLAADKVPREEMHRRIYALMGSLYGVGSAAIEKLSARDLSVVEVLGTVFSNA